MVWVCGGGRKAETTKSRAEEAPGGGGGGGGGCGTGGIVIWCWGGKKNRKKAPGVVFLKRKEGVHAGSYPPKTGGKICTANGGPPAAVKPETPRQSAVPAARPAEQHSTAKPLRHPKNAPEVLLPQEEQEQQEMAQLKAMINGLSDQKPEKACTESRSSPGSRN